MKQIMDYLHQKVPRAGRSFPAYYHRALSTSVVGMVVYYLAVCVMLFASGRRVEWVVLLMAAAMIGIRYSLGRVNARLSFYAFEALIVFWVGWHTQHVGWDYGAQHLLIPMLTFCFFNIYEPPAVKLATFFGVLAYRTVLFAYAQRIPTGYVMSPAMTVAYQTLNTLAVFNTLGICYVTFSSSIQESERQLLLNNQELHKEAGTDALTQLPNRRALLDVVSRFRTEQPTEAFSIAIADIDFFKRINDTYGHNCGDYTLQTLAALFRDFSHGRYTVCRWGGEEFCFFMPGMNIDEAGAVMQDLNFAVKKMPLHYGDIDFSIRITIGVEENDFRSSMEELFDQADRKLYMGKANGRDQVVV